MKGLLSMRMSSRLVLTLLLAPALLQAQAPAPAAAAAQAPTFSQRFKAGKPEVDRLQAAFEFREAFALAQTLLPETKPVFDKSSVNGVHTSCWNFIEAGKAYLLAYQTAERAGQWEKGLGFLATAIAIVKEGQALSLAPLNEQIGYYTKRAKDAKALLATNAEAVKALEAKPKVEDYEQPSLELVKSWEKDQADGEKWAKFFKYDIDMTARDVDFYTNSATALDTQVKEQQKSIDTYASHPGDKNKWVEAIVASKTYLESIGDKGERIALLCRLGVLDPENKKVEHLMDIQMGRSAADKKAGGKKTKS
jgi:hypothetical protein